MDKNYNVDDILSEIKGRKSREKSRGAPAEPPVLDELFASAPENIEPQADRVYTKPVMDTPTLSRPYTPADDIPPMTQNPSLRFSPAAEPAAKPAVEPVRISEPPSRAKEKEKAPIKEFRLTLPDLDAPLPEEQEAKRHNPLDFDGHVRPITDKAKLRRETPFAKLEFHTPENRAPENDGALRADLSAFKPAVEAPPASEHTRILPRKLFATGTGRELRIEDIRKLDFSTLNGDEEEAGYYEEDESSGAPYSANMDVGEYNATSDRREVANDIAHTKLWLFIRMSVTGVLCLILIYLAFAGKYQVPLPPVIWPENDLRMYMAACTVLTGIVAIVGSATVGGGLMSLFKMRANSDTLAALAILSTLAQGVAGIIKPDSIDPAGLNFYYAIAAVAMLFNALGKMTMISRIQMNFRVVAADRPKHAIMAVESDAFCHEFIKESTRHRPTIAYGVRAGFFTDFLALSYSDKYDVGVNRAVAPVCFLGSLVVGASTYFLTASMFAAISATTAILCVSATFSATFIENIPLGKLAKKLTPQGGMVSGNKAVEDFCDTRAVILSDNDLFPKGSVTLRGIRAFSKGRVDEAILDAASVICALDNPLSSVFFDMIGSNKKLLKRVDNIVYENGMGVSAWVDARRVLIGNRKLMQNHGIALPNDSYEQGRVPDAQGEPLYLSNSGEVSARFLVGYQIDEDLAAQLDFLALREKQLLIYTCDANITAEKLWELYGYPQELVTILPSERHAVYREMSAPRDTAVGELVYTGKAPAMVAVIAACINARSSILSATVLQLIQIILGYGFVAFLAFMGTIDTLSIVEVGIYQAFWFAAIFIIQQFKQS